ncbi:uncharacterized protein M6B38_140055 [Iris pallida]|uniref:Retrotransposon Copia-like N-terminal domain-containing protein n=1 Tax=Iris pallida TaxID=29817 RepID=A0AAX6FE45_IRIPA|nr:uncharacterized protein M6B38_140055 [Iris pallida]
MVSEHTVDSSIDSQGSSNDPFFVHHSDSSTAILVSPPLSGDNYGTWLRSISRALRAKNKFGFVDGTIQIPTDSNEKSKWSRCDDLVASWILNSVTQEIRGSILYADTALEIWKDLSDRYSQSNAPKIYQLKQSISSLKQENTTVSIYYTSLKSLWDELNFLSVVPVCTCGHGSAIAARLQEDRAMEFLQGLHDRFSAIRSQILLMEPFPSVAKIHNLVRQEEKQQEINAMMTPVPEAAALSTHFNKANQWNSNGKTNQRTSQPSSSQGKYFKHHGGTNNSQKVQPQREYHRDGKPRPYCDYCATHGHYRSTCFKLHGYPPKNAQANAVSTDTNSAHAQLLPTHHTFSTEQYNKILSMIDSGSSMPQANLTGPVIEEEDWIGTPP